MNRRTRRYRSSPPNWVGPALWVLAIAFLVLTILILVKTAPHQTAPVRSGPAAVAVPNRNQIIVPRIVPAVGSMASFSKVGKRQSSATPMRIRHGSLVAWSNPEKTYSS